MENPPGNANHAQNLEKCVYVQTRIDVDGIKKNKNASHALFSKQKMNVKININVHGMIEKVRESAPHATTLNGRRGVVMLLVVSGWSINNYVLLKELNFKRTE